MDHFLLKLFPQLWFRKIKCIPDIEISSSKKTLQMMLTSPFKNSLKVNFIFPDAKIFRKSAVEKLTPLLKKSDVTIFSSLASKYNFESQYQLKIKNAHCLYSSFNTLEILEKSRKSIESDNIENIFSKENIFISIGNISSSGYSQLIDAHQKLLREGFNHTVVVLGNGYDFDYLKRKIYKLKLSKTFFMLGSKSNPFPYIIRSKFYIHLSNNYAFPCEVCHALILNKPLICTDADGIYEMIQHQQQGLIIGKSTEELKSAMKMFLVNSRLTDSMVQKQKMYNFEHYRQTVSDQINKIFS